MQISMNLRPLLKTVKFFNSSVFTSDNQCPKIPYFGPLIYMFNQSHGFLQCIALKVRINLQMVLIKVMMFIFRA